MARPAPDEWLRHFDDFGPILAQALHNRGFEDRESAWQFLNSTALDDDPFALTDMETAVERISAALRAGESIAVYGDFDADGVCATALLTQVLAELGASVEHYIPDRVDEGYGLNAPALQNLAAKGVNLVVTVDCGIRAVAEVEAGRRAGLDIIVTDHHSLGPELPPALAVINPKRDEGGDKDKLAGVGVAFMLAKALLLERWQNDRNSYPRELRVSDLLDLVALGTVADIVPLNDPLNRRLLLHGLDTINEMRRPGIAALANVAGLRAGSIGAADIGFVLGPRINAAGRLGSAMTAFNLLTAPTVDEATPIAEELQRLNTFRQQLTNQAQNVISDLLADDDELTLIFAGDRDFHPGIVGLVAGRLSERFYRPSVILEIGSEVSRASCRSIPEFDITAALDECADLLIRHGGHAMAAGFTVDNNNVDLLGEMLAAKASRALSQRRLRRKLELDLEISLEEVTEKLVRELTALEPTGHRNPPVSFLSRDLQVASCRRVGQDGKHLKLKLRGSEGRPIDAIGFGLGDWARRIPRHIDAAFHAELNEWNGRRSLQMRLLDIRPAEQSY